MTIMKIIVPAAMALFAGTILANSDGTPGSDCATMSNVKYLMVYGNHMDGVILNNNLLNVTKADNNSLEVDAASGTILRSPK